MTKTANKVTEVKTAKTMQDYIAIGETLANAFMTAEKQADKVKQDLILQSAHAHAGNIEQVKAILGGFHSTFIASGMSANSAKQRKSEARRVFEAVAKTQVSEENLKTLQAFEGGYHGFIGLARDLCSDGETVKGETVSNRKAIVTEKQEDLINEKIKVAKIIQISDFMQTAVDTLNAPRSKEDASLAEKQQFILINAIANSMMSNDQYDEVTKKVAGEIYKLTNIQINRMEKAQGSVKEVIQEAQTA